MYLAAILPLVIIFILFINAVVPAESDRGTDAQDAKNIDPLSTVSLRLELRAYDYKGNICSVGRATGFVVKRKSSAYLITNFHVVSGLDAQTRKPIGTFPDEIKITYHAREFGKWVAVVEPLYDSKRKHRWIEHPTNPKVDVIALPLQNIDATKVKLYPLDLSLADHDMVMKPAMPVSIIGFPMGFSAEGVFPIWKTGYIASDHDLNVQFPSTLETIPAFMVDAITHPGMSGSPVFSRVYGG